MRCRQLIFQFPGQLLACPRTEENAVFVVSLSFLDLHWLLNPAFSTPHFRCAPTVLPECAKRGVPAGAATGVQQRAKTIVPDGAEAGVHPGRRPGAGAAVLSNSPASLPECA